MLSNEASPLYGQATSSRPARLHGVGDGPHVAEVEHAGQDVLAQGFELALRLGDRGDRAFEPARGFGGHPGAGGRVDLPGDAPAGHRRGQARRRRRRRGV